MNRKIKRVIIHLGNFRDAYGAYLTWEWEKASILQKKIFLAEDLTILWNRLCNKESYDDLVAKTYSSIAKSTYDLETVIIYCGRFSSSPSVLRELVATLSYLFPNAVLQSFFAIRPQICVRRAAFFWNTLYTSRQPKDISNSATFSCVDYYACVKAIFKCFPRQNIYFHTDGEDEEADLRTHNTFWDIVCNSLKIDPPKGFQSLFNVSWQFFCFFEQCFHLSNTAMLAVHKAWLTLAMQHIHHPSFPIFANEKTYNNFMYASRINNEKTAELLERPQLWTEEKQPESFSLLPALTATDLEKILHTVPVDLLAKIMKALKTVEGAFLSLEERTTYCAIKRHFTRFFPQKVSEPYSIDYFVDAKLSVLTSTYNHKNFIEKNIQSVINQKCEFPIAHIIADDASNDGTQEIILQYAKKYKHIYPIFQKERTYGKKNIADLFNFVRSPYVALCEGDDFFSDPTKLQSQVDYLERNPDYSMCFHPVKVLYEDGSDRHKVYPPIELMPRGARNYYYLADLLKANFIQTNSVVYRWRFREGLPSWFRSDLVPGDWYWHLLHAENGKIGFINKVMSVYRRHKNSLYYSAENTETSVPHRLLHGLKELETYDIINRHFEHRYERAIIGFTNNVLMDFLLHAQSTGDDTFLQKAGERYPNFMEYFLRDVQIGYHSSLAPENKYPEEHKN